MKFFNGLRRGVLITLGVSFLAFSTAANAADNTGTGDIAGDAAALQDSNTFSLLSTGSALQLVKRAFLMDGTPIVLGEGQQPLRVDLAAAFQQQAELTVSIGVPKVRALQRSFHIGKFCRFALIPA